VRGVVLGLAALVALAAMGLPGVLRRRFALVTVIGPSMQPALTAGDRVLVRRARISDLRAGQIVVFEKPGDDGAWVMEPPGWPVGRREWMIKRVAAIPGDPVPDAIMSAPAHTAEPAVPAGKLVVLGDNAALSLDSREIGYIPAERLLGVVLRPLAHR
jgi:signal peptidase I